MENCKPIFNALNFFVGLLVFLKMLQFRINTFSSLSLKFWIKLLCWSFKKWAPTGHFFSLFSSDSDQKMPKAGFELRISGAKSENCATTTDLIVIPSRSFARASITLFHFLTETLLPPLPRMLEVKKGGGAEKEEEEDARTCPRRSSQMCAANILKRQHLV